MISFEEEINRLEIVLSQYEMISESYLEKLQRMQYKYKKLSKLRGGLLVMNMKHRD